MSPRYTLSTGESFDVGRNDDCVCGSKSRLKKCCLRLLEDQSDALPPNSRVFVSSDTFWPDAVPSWPEIENLLLDYNRDELIRLLIKVNVLMTAGRATEGDRIAALINSIYPEPWRRKLRFWFSRGRFNALVPREVSLTALAKTIALPQELFRSNVALDAESILKVGPLLTKIASHVSRIDDHSFETGDDEHKKSLLYGAFFRSLYFRSESNIGSAVGRWWAIMTEGLPAAASKYPNSIKDVDAVFVENLGVDLRSILTGLVGVFAHYSKPFADLLAEPGAFGFNANYLRAVGKDEEAGARILRLLTVNIEVVRSELMVVDSTDPYSCASVFYNHPIVELKTDMLALVDLPALQGQLGQGVYWRAFNAAKDPAERGRLKTTVGHAFEWYCTKLVVDTFQDQCLSDWHGDLDVPEGDKSVDVVIRDGTNLLVCEITTSAPTPSVSLGGEWSAISTALERIWLGRGEDRESAKVGQLASFIKGYQSQRFELRGISRTSVRRLVPLLILLNPLPQYHGLTRAYRDLLKAGGVDPVLVDDLYWIDVEELELLCALKLAGHLPADLLDAWRSSLVAEQSFKNFVIGEGLERSRHRLTDGWMRAAFGEFEKLVRPS